MNDEKKPTFDELLEGLNGPFYMIDWKSDDADVQPKLLEELLAQCDPDVPLQDVDWGPDVGLEDIGSGDVPDEK
ncbi:AbrB/MazE/SpoVT family DNA-binding domain-containing protein [Aeromonas caviae]|uniref:AbrB/MazE/SpoVT family DNA-binding domain-containing protein n=1 Tax=Aeromonas caviae TaxID=648 RepID=UPI002B48E247|nr:hypothetical protein [Aeromonas caviae]